MPLAHPRALPAAIAAAIVIGLLTAPSADAGSYRAVQCHEAFDAGRADFAYARTGERYRGAADCDTFGLEITHEAGDEPTRGGRFGAWTLTAPEGTRIARVAARVAAAGQDWHAPQMAVTLADGARSAIAGVRGSIHTVSWAGEAARSLTARLACAHATRCGRGAEAYLRLRRVSVLLRDAVAPTLQLSGGLLDPGSRRGVQTLNAAAADAGGGIRSIVVEVNGEPLVARGFDCRLVQGIAVRLRPCPAAPTAGFDVVTTASRFRQGPNQLRVCAADFAAATNANRTCLTRGFRVDNRCPVSSVHGARLTARFAGGGTRLSARSDERVRVVGRLSDAAGAPVPGATVCVATRTLVAGSAEGFMATPRTGPDGTFAVELPPGPSREVRVAHWPGSERALERYLRLRVRAVPRLRLRPRRTLRNGERVRFRVGLPGPLAGGRRVEVQARADGRWITIAAGRANRRGRWTGAYRFRSTTGRRTYAFRATVAGQRGYPYERGVSAVRRATVVGRAAVKTKPG